MTLRPRLPNFHRIFVVVNAYVTYYVYVEFITRFVCILDYLIKIVYFNFKMNYVTCRIIVLVTDVLAFKFNLFQLNQRRGYPFFHYLPFICTCFFFLREENKII